jgi:hypothetical protein
MLTRGGTIAAAFAGGVLLTASAASACSDHSMNSTFAVLPGLSLWGGAAAPAIWLLAALIERPFVTWAGVRKHAIGWSIQANLLAGLGVGVVGFVLGTAGILWIPFAVVASYMIKCAWLGRALPTPSHLGRGWIGLGCLASGLVIALLPAWRGIVGTDTYAWTWRVQRMDALPAVLLATVAAAAVAMIAAFALTPRERPAHEYTGHGFDVLPPTRRPD